MEDLTFKIYYDGEFDEHHLTQGGDVCYTSRASVEDSFEIEIGKTNALNIKVAIQEHVDGLSSIEPIKINKVLYYEEDYYTFDIQIDADNARILYLY